jgi:hypothetical protein
MLSGVFMKVRLMLGCLWALLPSLSWVQVPAAELALVEGDPSMHPSDLRQTRLVVPDGKLLDADALREAAGYSGRPK